MDVCQGPVRVACRRPDLGLTYERGIESFPGFTDGAASFFADSRRDWDDEETKVQVAGKYHRIPQHPLGPRTTPSGARFGVQCEPSGKVASVVFNEFGVTNRLLIGQPLTTIVDSRHLPKALNFIQTIQERRVSSCALDIVSSRGTVPGFFCGCCIGRGILVVGTARPQPIADLQGYTTAMDKNANALQTTRKSFGVSGTSKAAVELNQLTRLNSELVNAQRQLAKKHAELEKVSLERSEVLGMLAHDLRNPLSGILNASDYLLEDAAGLLGENDLSLLQAVQRSSRLMLMLIDDILEISAIESDKLKLDRKPTDILSLIEQNLALNRPLAERKQIRIDVIAYRALPAISVDPVKTYRVIDNLVTNAIKFSASGTRIEIRVDASRKSASISVRDQGPGIPAEELKTVFKAFEKGRHTSTAPGAGLGLAIAKRIVEEHGGQLRLESQVGKGSTFTITLPVSTRTPQGTPPRSRTSRTIRRVIASAAS